MKCERCDAPIGEHDGAVVRVEWVGRWMQDVRDAKVEKRRLASVNSVLCDRCGERAVDQLRHITHVSTTSQERPRMVPVQDDAAVVGHFE